MMLSMSGDADSTGANSYDQCAVTDVSLGCGQNSQGCVDGGRRVEVIADLEMH